MSLYPSSSVKTANGFRDGDAPLSRRLTSSRATISNPLARKLGSFVDLSPQDVAALARLSARSRWYPAGTDLIQAGDRPDHVFLLKGNVFTKDFIDSYIDLRMAEVMAYETMPHPIEYSMYYSV